MKILLCFNGFSAELLLHIKMRTMEEDEGLEWEDKEDEESDGNMKWIVNKGWAMGKKMLITSVIVSSAPVILPPLMVISTLGLVCAVPYGFLLSTYACTEKLLSIFLPGPKEFPEAYEERREKDYYEEYGGDADVANEAEEKENCEGGVNDRDETEETPGVMVVVEGQGENGSVKEVTVEVTDVAVELCERDDVEANEEIAKETTGLLEKIRDEGLSSEGTEQNEVNVEGTERNTETTKGTERNTETTATKSQLGDGNGGKANETEASEVMNTNGKGIVDEGGIQLIGDEQKVLKENATSGGNLKPGLKDIGFLEVSVPSNVSSPGSGRVVSKEAVYSEEKIWKQIDAVRAIIGYTNPRHTTCLEELKALYVFTGVEPPASFKDHSDLEEINDKLRFLMSVVGVK